MRGVVAFAVMMIACGNLPLTGDDVAEGGVADASVDGDIDDVTVASCDASTQTDPANCGACGHVCTAPDGSIPTCAGGTCGSQCGAGKTICSGVCVDLQTSSQNCGSCGRDCLGSACAVGACASTILATSPAVVSAFAIAVDSSYVYWGAGAGIYRVLKSGGNVETVTSQLGKPPDTLVIDGSTIYFTLASYPYTNGTIESIASDGSTGAMIVYANQTFGNSITNLAVDAVNLYWSSNGNGVDPSSINQAPKNGSGPVTTLATNQDYPQSIAVDGTSVYWVNYDTFAKTPIDGGAIVTLGQQQVVGNIAVGPNRIALGQYDGNGDAGTIGLYALDGGSISSTVIEPFPFQIALDSQYVYASTYTTIVAAPLDGGASVDAVLGEKLPQGIVTDDQRVYWLDYGDSTVRSAPKL